MQQGSALAKVARIAALILLTLIVASDTETTTALLCAVTHALMRAKKIIFTIWTYINRSCIHEYQRQSKECIVY